MGDSYKGGWGSVLFSQNPPNYSFLIGNNVFLPWLWHAACLWCLNIFYYLQIFLCFFLQPSPTWRHGFHTLEKSLLLVKFKVFSKFCLMMTHTYEVMMHIYYIMAGSMEIKSINFGPTYPGFKSWHCHLLICDLGLKLLVPQFSHL